MLMSIYYLAADIFGHDTGAKTSTALCIFLNISPSWLCSRNCSRLTEVHGYSSLSPDHTLEQDPLRPYWDKGYTETLIVVHAGYCQHPAERKNPLLTIIQIGLHYNCWIMHAPDRELTHCSSFTRVVYIRSPRKGLSVLTNVYQFKWKFRVL